MTGPCGITAPPGVLGSIAASESIQPVDWLPWVSFSFLDFYPLMLDASWGFLEEKANKKEQGTTESWNIPSFHEAEKVQKKTVESELCCKAPEGFDCCIFFFTCVLIYRLHYCTMSWDFISNLFHKIWCFLNIQVCVLGSGLTKSIFPFLKESRVGEMVLADLPEVPTG